MLFSPLVVFYVPLKKPWNSKMCVSCHIQSQQVIYEHCGITSCVFWANWTDHQSVSRVCTNFIQSNMRIFFFALHLLKHQNTSTSNLWPWCCVEVKGHNVSPLFAAAVNSRRLVWGGLEDGSEDGNILLEDDRRHSEVSLQLLGALTEVLRQVGHVLPLLHLIKELYEAAEDSRQWGGAAQRQPFMLHILI